MHQSTAARRLLWCTTPQVGMKKKRCDPSISQLCPHGISLLLKRITFGRFPCRRAPFSILDRDSASCRCTLGCIPSCRCTLGLRCRISALPVLLCSYQRSRWCVLRIYSSTLLMTPYVDYLVHQEIVIPSQVIVFTHSTLSWVGAKTLNHLGTSSKLCEQFQHDPTAPGCFRQHLVSFVIQ